MMIRFPSRAVVFAALFVGPGCLESLSSPTVGECAVYPKGVYDYGEIGIGSCLAGPIGMEWGMLSRADFLTDEEVVAALARAGCRSIDMGVESLKQEVLDKINEGGAEPE